MKNSSGFQVENKIKAFVKYVDTHISVSVPKVHCNLRIHLQDECYNLIRNLYEAIWTKGNIRLKNITEMLVSISLLDYYIDLVGDIKCVPKKKIETSISLLTDIKILVQGWRKNCESEKSQKETML